MQVVISEERSKNLEEIEKVKPFLPIFEKHARFLGIPISIDVPHGQIISSINDEKFHVHIFSNSAGDVKRELSSIFGFKLPNEGIEKVQERILGTQEWITKLRGDDVALAFSISEEGENLFSPEGDVIIKIHPRNIYILFDFFHQEWKGQDLVLDQILEEAILRALLKDSQDYLWDQRLARTYQQNLVRYYSRQFRRNKDKVQEGFVQFCVFATKKKLSEVQSSLDEEREKHEKATQDLADAYLQLEILQDQLEEFECLASYSLEKYAQEFDSILRMEHVRGVRVKETEEGEKSIVVYTDRIFQQPEDGNQYDIGEIEIWITPGKQFSCFYESNPWITPPGIQFKQGVYRGTHKHHEVDQPHVCFGNRSSGKHGFNPEVNKLYQDGDYFAIIHWSLFLLEMDIRLPPERKTDSVSAICSPSSEPFYSSKEDEKKERTAYAELVKHFNEERTKKYLENAFDRVKGKLKTKGTKFSEIRTSLKNTLYLRDNLEKRVLALSLRGNEEFEKLLQEKDIAEIRIFEDLLQVLVRTKTGKNISALARIWIYPLSGKIWIRGFSPALVGEDLYKILLESMAKGELSKTIFLLRDFLF